MPRRLPKIQRDSDQSKAVAQSENPATLAKASSQLETLQIAARLFGRQLIGFALLLLFGSTLGTVEIGATEVTAVAADGTPEDGTIVLSVSNDKGVERVFGCTGKQVIFQVTGRSLGSDRIPLKFSTTTVLSLGLTGAPPLGEDYGAVHVIRLAPGRYVLETWTILTPGIPAGHMNILEPRQQPPPLHFEVRSGEARYLGNLHATLVHEKKGVFGGMFLVAGRPEVRDRTERDVAVARESTSNIQEPVKIDLLPIGPWSAD